MLPVAFALMFLGFPVAFCMMITAVLFGLVVFGDRVVFQFIEKIDDLSTNFVFAAVPLFVFMGSMLERSGIADKLFEAIHMWSRRLPGGLAVGTILMCIIFPASIMAGLYIAYILGLTIIWPHTGPRIPRTADEPTLAQKLRVTAEA